ncbi:MAG: hypothetical protein ACI90V_011485, partial [Bacillariaceae sp.]
GTSWKLNVKKLKSYQHTTYSINQRRSTKKMQ